MVGQTKRSLAPALLVLLLIALSTEPATALCIGCGCQRNFNTCMSGVGACSFKDPYGEVYTDSRCCEELRNDCHTCSSGFVCVRFLAPSGAFETVDFDDLTPEQLEQTAPFSPVLDKFQAGVSLQTFDYALIDDTTVAVKKGMTWGKGAHNPKLGTDVVTCHAGTGCNPYEGDTGCGEERPILCLKQDGSRPNECGPNWAGGHIGTTLPIQGIQLLSPENANKICAESFGEGWRMAEFHDGSGWFFEAYGNVRQDSRFWVYIDDQPANCWNQGKDVIPGFNRHSALAD